MARHVLDEREEHRLGPVRVVEHDDERAVSGEPRRTASERPRSPPRRRLSSPTRPVSCAIASATLRASSAGARSASSFATASSPPSFSSMPAACLTISASGQNVMPSPYGRHRPCSTVARSPSSRDELVREPRLPDTGRADDGEEPATVLGHRSARAPTRAGRACRGGRRAEPPDAAPARDRPLQREQPWQRLARLALELEGRHELRVDRCRGRAGTSTRRAGCRPARRSAGDGRRCSPCRRRRSCDRGRCPCRQPSPC